MWWQKVALVQSRRRELNQLFFTDALDRDNQMVVQTVLGRRSAMQVLTFSGMQGYQDCVALLSEATRIGHRRTRARDDWRGWAGSEFAISRFYPNFPNIDTFGTRFQVTFSAPVTYPYICALHDTLVMAGTIQVVP